MPAYGTPGVAQAALDEPRDRGERGRARTLVRAARTRSIASDRLAERHRSPMLDAENSCGRIVRYRNRRNCPASLAGSRRRRDRRGRRSEQSIRKVTMAIPVADDQLSHDGIPQLGPIPSASSTSRSMSSAIALTTPADRATTATLLARRCDDMARPCDNNFRKSRRETGRSGDGGRHCCQPPSAPSEGSAGVR